MKNTKGRRGTVGDEVLSLELTQQTAFEKALKTAKTVKKKKEADATERASSLKSGVILLNHIPFGFFEKEIRGFFSQFGKVLRIRVARSEKTGLSKGYAFIEFEFVDVAKIAAECMDGYLMFERLLKCELLPQDVNTYRIFSKRHISEQNYPKLKSRMKVKSQQRSPQSPEQASKLLQIRLCKLEEHNRKLSEKGIDYEYPTPVNSS